MRRTHAAVAAFVCMLAMLCGAAGAAETRAMTPAEVTAFMQAEVDKWVPVARRVADQN
jgi:hypothetical protein